MAAKDFVVRNGLVVNNNVIYATAGKVGINNNAPNATLHVTGSGYFSGDLDVDGVLTFANTTSLNGAVFIANSLTTTGFANIGGHLRVASYSNLVGNVTIGGFANVAGSLNVGGDTTLVNMSASNGVFSNLTVQNTLTVSNAASVNTLSVTGTSNVTGTATFNGAVIAAFTPTTNNHLVNKLYADAASNNKMPLTGGTFTGDIAISKDAPTITLNDTVSGNVFYVHCNSGVAGFVRPNFVGWAFYTDVSGNMTVAGSLNVGTTIYAGGNITGFSDERLKKEIKTINQGLDMVKKMRGVFFKFKENDKPGVGVIAQELKQILPQAVEQTEDGILSVAYGNIVGVLIEAVKELSDKVEELEKKVKG